MAGIMVGAIVTVILALSAICLVNSKPYHPVTTYFGRVHRNGSIVDQKNPNTRVKFFGKQRHLKVSQTNAALKVTPFHIQNGDTVTVSWTGISSPTDRDIVGIYCPETNEDKDYLDYEWAKNFPENEFSVTLYNLRSSCEFRYYTFNPFEELVARSNLVTFEGGPEAPLQGHLALTGDPTQMRVMWVSSTGPEIPPEVRYFSADGRKLYKKITKGTTKTYKASDMCNYPAMSESVGHFMDPGFIHDVLLTELKPSTLYYYQYGTNLGMSPLKNFTTAPLLNPDASFTWIAYGDQGVSPFPRGRATAKYSLEEVLYRNASFVVHLGDIAYAEGFAYQWEKFFAEIESYASLVPYMVGIGNHEQDHESGGERDPSGAPGEGFHPWFAPELFHYDSGGECGVPMYYRFHMPENGNYLWWYSFNYGSLHFIMMSTEHNFTRGSRQYNWIENDLRKVNRSQTPWIVIGGHRAMYSSQKYYGDYMLSLGLRHSLEEMLHKYKVNMALWAHYHSYERTCAVYKGECVEGGIVHITVGTAGKTFDTNGFMPMKWSLYQAIEFGYGRVTMYSKNAMLWEWIMNKDKKVADKVLITQ